MAVAAAKETEAPAAVPGGADDRREERARSPAGALSPDPGERDPTIEEIMPGMNGTGPGGEGPRTGRGMGRCRPGAKAKRPPEVEEGAAVEQAETPEQSGWSGGFGGGGGRGRGRCRGNGGRGRGGGFGGGGGGGGRRVRMRQRVSADPETTSPDE